MSQAVDQPEGERKEEWDVPASSSFRTDLSSFSAPTITERFAMGGRAVLFTRPEDPDQLLDDPRVRAASEADDYMPYWAYLWPGSWLLAEAVLAECWPRGLSALELGCGLGLSGLAGLCAGLSVCFSDYEMESLKFAAFNARQNGFRSFRARRMDWRQPLSERFSVILAADVLYELRLHRMVLGALDAMLTDDGVCWISDPDRVAAQGFPDLLEPAGFAWERRPACATLPDGRQAIGSILIVRRRKGASARPEGAP